MARADLETFIRECAAEFDESLDLSPGSPFDAKVTQRILDRLGVDPFTVDLMTFIEARLRQEFPDLAVGGGDAVTDLLAKPAVILWDSIIREIQRTDNAKSFRNPELLTLDEATALGGNIFSEPSSGDFATGQVRLLYGAPVDVRVGPANFVTSKTGLHFYPRNVQSVRADQMVFNVEGSLYYFDINVIAENAGESYNIGPNEVISIANMPGVVRVTNKRRFRDGVRAESAIEFVGRAKSELTERSLVTLRGISTVIRSTFTEINRLNVIGHSDPEMQRDVLRGGGYGIIRASGLAGEMQPDGENQVRTRRVILPEAVSLATPNGLLEIVGPPAVGAKGWVLTLVNAFGGELPVIRDLPVRAIVDATRLDLEDQVVAQTGDTWTWMLRKKELTLAGIPGGILFPDNVNGTVSIPNDEVHIGGVNDVLVAGSGFDTASLVVSAVTDDRPLLFGVALDVVDAGGTVRLDDLVDGATYSIGDSTSTTLRQAVTRAHSLQILDGPAAGSYRVVFMQETAGAAVQLTLSPTPEFAASPAFENLRWKLVDVLDIDLVEPRETRLSGSDLSTVQGVDEIELSSGIDMTAYAVAEGDTLEIENGPDAGTYRILEVLSPLFSKARVDRELTFTTGFLRYSIYRPNAAGGIQRPFMRVTSMDLLDTSGQPTGSKIPYARAVDVRSTSFSNAGRGVRAEARDGILGLCGDPLSGSPPEAAVGGLTLNLQWNNGANSAALVFAAGPVLLLTEIVDQINAAVGARMAVVVDGDRLGLVPFGFTEVLGGTAVPLLFSAEFLPTTYLTSRDIRSRFVEATYDGWGELQPPPDPQFDVVNILEGTQVGFYGDTNVGLAPPGLTPSGSLTTSGDFAPQVGIFLQFGSRSLGSARVYFLEPTSVSFETTTRFQTTLSSGVTLNFYPDRTLEHQLVPALPAGTKPRDGVNANSTVMQTPSVNPITKNVLAGDILVLDYVPITGTAVLSDPIADLQFQTLVLSIGEGVDKTITFLQDSVAIPANSVTRAGVVAQINAAVGQTVCSIVTNAGSNYLEFDADLAIKVRRTGTANLALLGAGFVGVDVTNESLNAGRYQVVSVTSSTITIDPLLAPFGFSTNLARQQYKIIRPGLQRIGATQMEENTAPASLYFVDVQLVSEGTGDLWNIESDLEMWAEGYSSDGYWLETDDENLSFSPVEPLRLRLSRSILEVGVSDDPDNATQLSGQNVQVNYEMSATVSAVDNFMRSETERVVCSNPLARHLIPNFVRFDLEYVGGSRENIIKPLIEQLVIQTPPNEPLESSDIQKVVTGKGATSISNPLELVAVVHNFDRSITLDRSNDRLSVTRLAAFIPDIINLSRKVS